MTDQEMNNEEQDGEAAQDPADPPSHEKYSFIRGAIAFGATLWF